MTGFTENSISTSWTIPEDDGGCDISGYVLERREASRSTWNNSMDTDELAYTVNKLEKGKKYYIRVAAVNEMGQGPFVALDEPVTAKSEHDPPSAPLNPQVWCILYYMLFV